MNMGVLHLLVILGVTLYRNVLNRPKNAYSLMAVIEMSMAASVVQGTLGAILNRNASDLGKKTVLKKYIKMCMDV